MIFGAPPPDDKPQAPVIDQKVHVAAAVILDGTRALVARRAEGQALAGHWEFPGGKIENWETPQECVEREMFEEFGVRAKAGAVLLETSHVYPNVALELVAVLASIVDGTLTPTVHDKAEWVDIEDLSRRKLAPADKPIADRLLALLNSGAA